MRSTTLLILAALALTGPAGAAGRDRIERSDFAPAVATQYARPDGGKRYEYPPNTGNIVRAQDKTAYDKPPSDPASKSSRPEPVSAPTNPATKPPDRVGR